MKVCPRCRKQYEDRLMNCTVDGAPLLEARGEWRASAAPGVPVKAYEAAGLNRFEPRVNGWKVAFFVMLAITVIGNGGLAAYFFLLKDAEPPPSEPARSGAEAKVEEHAVEAEHPDTLRSIAELSPEELFEILPKNLLRRFHTGEPTQGKPDDFRVIKDEKGEYVALIGQGRLDGGPQTSARRIMILHYEDNQFRDVTKQLLPPAYSRGAITGRLSQVKFESTGPTIIVRDPVSSNAVVSECSSCDHAYQQATLEWKASRYNETARAWDNERYTVLYVVADALDKRRIDDLARPFIDQSLEARVAEGFARRGKEGWAVQLLEDFSNQDTCRYEINNGEELLIVTLTRVNGQWKAVRISVD